MKLPIYMDHQTTTPIDREVLEAMMPYLTDQFGDPSSLSHAWGWAAEEAVDRARDQVASLIGAQPEEIFFTSGATESDNLAIKGIARAYKGRVITRHPADGTSRRPRFLPHPGAGRVCDHLSAGGPVMAWSILQAVRRRSPIKPSS